MSSMKNGQLRGISVRSSTARKLIGVSDTDKLKRLTLAAALEASIKHTHAQYTPHLKKVVQFVGEKPNSKAWQIERHSQMQMAHALFSF